MKPDPFDTHRTAEALVMRGGTVLSQHRTANQARIAAICETRRNPEPVEIHFRWTPITERYAGGERTK
jgi:hypothetical protein